MNLRFFPLLALSLMMLTGCTSVKAVFAMQKSTEHFLSLPDNPAVKYEPGAQSNAARAAQYLPEAIATVEARQYAVFPDDVVIYLPNTIDSFRAYATTGIPRGIVIGGKLFLSPRLFEQSDVHIMGILEHELSHLLITQKLGRWDAQRNIPPWFAEGLAVYVSDGAGAEKVSEEEAAQSIRSEKAIVPDGTGSLLFRKTAHSFSIRTEMFYRQSSMYVVWLHEQDPAAFKHFLEFIYQGETVGEAMLHSYGFTVGEGWERFKNELSDT